MGSRACISVRERQSDKAVFLYTHWRGYQTPSILQQALSAHERFRDAPYLARIIFDTMTNLEGSTIGFGIQLEAPPDIEFPTLHVVTEEQRIYITKSDNLRNSDFNLTFLEFLELKDPLSLQGWRE